MSQFSRIWIEDDKGKLRPIFIKPGVTDNTYTEIAWGNLEEGQLVITGTSSSSRDRFRGGMMFMRRR
jgi:HlyD family secretion protein